MKNKSNVCSSFDFSFALENNICRLLNNHPLKMLLTELETFSNIAQMKLVWSLVFIQRLWQCKAKLWNWIRTYIYTISEVSLLTFRQIVRTTNLKNICSCN